LDRLKEFRTKSVILVMELFSGLKGCQDIVFKKQNTVNKSTRYINPKAISKNMRLEIRGARSWKKFSAAEISKFNFKILPIIMLLTVFSLK